MLYTYLRMFDTRQTHTYTHTYGQYSDMMIYLHTQTQQQFTYIFNISWLLKYFGKVIYIPDTLIKLYLIEENQQKKYQTNKTQTWKVYFRKYTLKNTKPVGILYAWAKKRYTDKLRSCPEKCRRIALLFRRLSLFSFWFIDYETIRFSQRNQNQPVTKYQLQYIVLPIRTYVSRIYKKT